MNDPFPVIPAVYDAQAEVAYWLYVQRHFQRQSNFSIFTAGRTITVHIPLSDLLDAAAVRRFAHFRNAVNRQFPRSMEHDT